MHFQVSPISKQLHVEEITQKFSLDDTLKARTRNRNIYEAPPARPLFSFSQQDQTLNELVQNGICDNFGEPLIKDCPSECFYIPIKSKKMQVVYQKIIKFLHDSNDLQTKAFINRAFPPSLDVSFNFFDYLSFLQKKTSTDKIQTQIFLIGSFLKKILGYVPFYKASSSLFRNRITKERLRILYLRPHVQDQFHKQCNDIDFSIVNANNIENQIQFEQYIFDFFAKSIQQIDIFPYVPLLPRKEREYYGIVPSYPHIIEGIKRDCIKYLGGMCKRKTIDKTMTKYTIHSFSLKADNTAKKNIQFFDTLLVCLEEGKPLLERPNLSSTTCLKLSLTNFLQKKTSSKKEKCKFFYLNTDVFSPQKVLIGILCGVGFYRSERHVDDWLRAIRLDERCLTPGIAQSMAKKVWEYKSEFLSEYYSNNKIPVNDLNTVSDGLYLFYLLRQEVVKNQSNFQNQAMQAKKSFAFVYRACQFLHVYSSVSEQTFAELWQLIKEYQLISIEAHGDNLFYLIQQALIEKKLPFRLVSAWIGYLLWLQNPLAATTHCSEPVFHFTKRALGFWPIRPLMYSKIILEGFSEDWNSIFYEIYRAFPTTTKNNCFPHTLRFYFDELHLIPLTVAKESEKWIYQPAVFLQLLGIQSYFITLPEKLQEELGSEFSLLVEKISSVLPENDPLCCTMAWINFSIKNPHEQLLHLAYKMWKISGKQIIHKHRETVWSLFDVFCTFQPRYALHLFQQLEETYLYEVNEICSLEDFHTKRMKKIQSLLAAYCMTPQRLKVDSEELLPILFLYLENSTVSFARSVGPITKFIEILYSGISDKKEGDNLLLVATHKQYLSNEWQIEKWKERLENLLSQQQYIYAFSMWQALKGQKIWDIYATAFQNFQTKLFEKLVEENQFSFAFSLLQSYENPAHEACFYQTIYTLFFSYAPESFQKEHLQFVQKLQVITPSHKRFEAQKIFLYVCTVLLDQWQKDFSYSASIEWLDHFISTDQIMVYLLNVEEEWQDFFLKYIEKTSFYQAEARFSTLIKIYENFMRLGKTKTKYTFSTCPYLILSKLLHASDQKPSSKLCAWLEKIYPKIFKYFSTEKRINELSFLLLRFSALFALQNCVGYLWEACLELKKTKNQDIVKLLALTSLQEIKQLTPFTPCKDILDIVEILVKNKEFSPTQIWEWLEWSFTLEQQSSEQERRKQLYVTCLHQFIAIQQYENAFDSLQKALSYVNFLHAQEIWIMCLQGLAATISIEKCHALLLSSDALSFLKNPNALPVIEGIMKRYTLLPYKAENHLIFLQLMQEYEQNHVEQWHYFWQTVPIHETAVSMQGWQLFRQQKSFEGSSELLATCWKNAFMCIQKNSKELAVYFYDRAWLNVFTHNSDRLQALQMIFIAIIEQLSPTKYDQKLFSIILKTKEEVQLPLSSNVQKKWNFLIECALIKKLYTSKNLICLQELLPLFKSVLSASFSSLNEYSETFLFLCHICNNIAEMKEQFMSLIDEMSSRADLTLKIRQRIVKQLIKCSIFSRLNNGLQVVHKLIDEEIKNSEKKQKITCETKSLCFQTCLLAVQNEHIELIHLKEIEQIWKKAQKLWTFSRVNINELNEHYLNKILDKSFQNAEKQKFPINLLESSLKIYNDQIVPFIKNGVYKIELVSKIVKHVEITYTNMDQGACESLSKLLNWFEFVLIGKTVMKNDKKFTERAVIDNLLNYNLFVIQEFKRRKFSEPFIAQTIHQHIKNKLRKFYIDSYDQEEIVLFIQELAYGLIRHLDVPIKDHPSCQLALSLIRQSATKEILKNFPILRFGLECWFDEKFESNGYKISVDEEINLAASLSEFLYTYQSPQHISQAIFILQRLMKKAMSIKNFAYCKPIYAKLLENLQPYLCVKQDNYYLGQKIFGVFSASIDSRQELINHLELCKFFEEIFENRLKNSVKDANDLILQSVLYRIYFQLIKTSIEWNFELKGNFNFSLYRQVLRELFDGYLKTILKQAKKNDNYQVFNELASGYISAVSLSGLSSSVSGQTPYIPRSVDWIQSTAMKKNWKIVYRTPNENQECGVD